MNIATEGKVHDGNLVQHELRWPEGSAHLVLIIVVSPPE